MLALTAALNPKLLATDLLLIENRRPRAMFLCVLLGGFTVGITIGLLDVLVFHLDADRSRGPLTPTHDGRGQAGEHVCPGSHRLRFGPTRSERQ